MINFFNKVTLIPNLTALQGLLTGLHNDINKSCFYCDRIAIKHYSRGNLNVIRAWNTPSVLDIWYNDFKTSSFVCAIDYAVKDDHIKIEYFNMNDDESCSIFPSPDGLNHKEAKELNRAMIDFVKQIAENEKKKKIVIDVHQNLRIFNKYYGCEGFTATKRKCSDNPYWIEAEMLTTKT